jgi:MinD-like ATPase involved in chromosome partitioning or flagellar assembly
MAAEEQATSISARFRRALNGAVYTTDPEWGQGLIAEYRVSPYIRIRTATAQPDLLMEAIRRENLELILVDNDLATGESGLAVAERIVRQHPKVLVYLVSATPSMALHHEAVSRGIRSVLAKPFSQDELLAVVSASLAVDQAAEERMQMAGRSPAARSALTPAPRLIAVGGGKGGVGKSEIATNLATVVQTNPAQRLDACIGDLERNDGAVPYLLGIPKRPTLTDWTAHVGQETTTLDPGLVAKQLVAEHSTGLHALCTADRVRDYDELDPHVVQVALNTLRLMHAVTVVDCPPTLTAPSMEAYSQATTILVVTELDTVSVAATHRFLLEVGSEGVDLAKVRILYNRVRPKSPITVEEASQVLADYATLVVTLPEDDSVAVARRDAKPTTLQYPDCPWSRALRRVAAEILPGIGLEVAALSGNGRRATPSRPVRARRKILGIF